MEASPVLELVGAILGLLAVSAIVLAFCKRYKLPFTVLLVLVGIGLTYLGDVGPSAMRHYFQFHISPDVIFYVCLPTLLFESALNLNARQLQRNMLPVLTLAIPGLLLSTALIGFIVSSLTSIPLVPALLLGAILSATDPVAVISIFKQLGAPKRLTVLVEGESLFNDATSIVTAKILFGVLMAGVFTSHHLWDGIYDFFFEFIGGVVVGWVIAIIVGYILGKVDSEPEIEISLTTILAYASFIFAQEVVHVSGVMATVAAGLTMTRWGRSKISPSVTQYLHQFWEYLAYIANAVIFLLVGLSVNLGALSHALAPLLVVILAMLLSRIAVVYLLVPLVGKLPNSDPISRPYQAVMYWGGLRGAIALAIILSLGEFQYSELFIALTMGAVLFTLLFQGLTIEKLVHFLKLDIPPLADRLARVEGELSATRKAVEVIPECQRDGLYSARIAADLHSRLDKDLKSASSALEKLRKEELNEEEEKRLLFLQVLATERRMYYELFAKGHISERAYRTLRDIVESQIDVLRYGGDIETASTIHHTTHPISKLFIRLFDPLPLLNRYASRLRALRIAREYEEFWGLHMAATAVLHHLSAIEASEPGKKAVVNYVRGYFKTWNTKTQALMDSITEQFPEFVTAMQERLAERLVLQAEFTAISEQQHEGSIPHSVAEILLQDLNNRVYKLRERPSTKIELDPTELLHKVPFFEALASEDCERVAKLLRSKITQANETVIKQGETGDSLFFIMRGVVRVYKEKDGKETAIATLMAGDFFGEMALLTQEPRVATCRAMTPCALYELKRQDFEQLTKEHPSILEAVKKTEQERRAIL